MSSATYFRSAAAFRDWLAENHTQASELLVGFHKVSSAKKGITYKESVDEALCFGWIDGVRRGVDDGRYTIRFTPRKKGSIWSLVNVKRMEELLAEGRVAPSGKRAFEARLAHKTGVYSFEKAPAVFEDGMEKAFRRNAKAWAFFTSQAPWYQRVAKHWVTIAKKDETRARRLATLVADSAAGRRIALVAKYQKQR